MSEPTKVCANPDCGRTLPLSDFYARSTSPDGRQSWCKSCSRERRAEWAKANRKRLHKLNRRTYRRRMADADRASIERVRKREWQRQRNGVRPEHYRRSPFTCFERETEPLLAPGPIADWFRYIIERDRSNAKATAARLGIGQKTMREILKERREVELDTIERALIADDTITLRELYPDLYGEAAA